MVCHGLGGEHRGKLYREFVLSAGHQFGAVEAKQCGTEAGGNMYVYLFNVKSFI